MFLHPGWGIIPALELRFSKVDVVELSGWFLTSPKSAARRSKELPYIALQIWTDAWLKDPELMAMTEFGYSGPRDEPKPVPTTGPSLEDLGI